MDKREIFSRFFKSNKKMKQLISTSIVQCYVCQKMSNTQNQTSPFLVYLVNKKKKKS